MKALLKTAVALAASLMLAAPAVAQDYSVEGVWTLKDKSSDYRATLCGKNGDRLCFELIALRKGADKPKNRKYLNTRIINEARPAGPNRWKGSISLYGQSANGTLVMLGDTMKVNACAYVVICDEFNLYRVK